MSMSADVLNISTNVLYKNNIIGYIGIGRLIFSATQTKVGMQTKYQHSWNIASLLKSVNQNVGVCGGV